MKTKELKLLCINLSDFMEVLNEQELDELNDVLDAFTFGGEGMTLIPTSSFEYELSTAPRVEEKFATFRESENYAFHFINLSE